MKQLYLLIVEAALILLLVAVARAQFVNDASLIKAINTNPKSTWTAKAHPMFDGITVEQLQNKREGLVLTKKQNTIHAKASKNNIPDSFDLRDVHHRCQLNYIFDEGQCGALGYIQTVAALGDRVCINQGQRSLPSPQHMISCNTNNTFGCSGTTLEAAFDFLEEHGTVSNNCKPYTSAARSVAPCSHLCYDEETVAKPQYFIKKGSLRYYNSSTVEYAQRDLMQGGSLLAVFMQYRDYFLYSSGVYQPQEKGDSRVHRVVRVVGWGVDEQFGLPYWIVGDTVGSAFGNHGFVWFLRGSNAAGIEDNLIAFDTEYRE